MNLLFRVFLCFFVFPQTFYLLLFPRIIQLRGLLLLLLWRWTTVLTQLGDGLVWLLGSCKWKWTRRRRSVAIPPPVPPPPPIPSRLLHCIRHVLFFPSLFCSTSLSARRSLAHFPSCIFSSYVRHWRNILIYMADIFSLVPKNCAGVSVTDVWIQVARSKGESRNDVTEIFGTNKEKKKKSKPKKYHPRNGQDMGGKVECRRRGSWRMTQQQQPA
jgi:hypothetical protein